MLPASRKDAISVSSKMLSCATEEPNIAGSMSPKIRRTPSCARSQRGFGRRPRRRKNGSWNESCTTPAANTPAASPAPGHGERGSTQPAKAIIVTFSSTGVNAATAKRRCEFRMLPASAVSDTKSTYGNVSRSIRTASGKRPASSRNPGANTRITSGAATTPTAVTTNSTSASVPVVRSMSSRVSASERVARYSEITGTNACEKAPSPKRRRSRFGMRKATKNASVASPAPKILAMKKSRTKPRIRETSVKLLTVARARSRFILRPFCGGSC